MVGGVRGKGRDRKTWMECVKKDIKECGLKMEDAQNRPLWSRVGQLLVALRIVCRLRQKGNCSISAQAVLCGLPAREGCWPTTSVHLTGHDYAAQ